MNKLQQENERLRREIGILKNQLKEKDRELFGVYTFSGNIISISETHDGWLFDEITGIHNDNEEDLSLRDSTFPLNLNLAK